MENSPNRRLFLGLAGAALVAPACKPTTSRRVAFDRALDKPYVPGAERFASHEERFVNTSCAQCPAGCGVRVRVVEGRAVRIEGNVNNPLNRGGIGPRGLAGLQALYDPDRLIGPMVRQGGRLVATSWDEAIGRVTAQLAGLRSRGEPHRAVVMTGRARGMMVDLWQRFARAFGTPNVIGDGRSAAISQAMQAAVGHYTLPAYDWADAKFVLSLEAGLLEDSCQAVYFTRGAAEARHGRRGGRARIVHVGPSFDLAAYNADEWVQIAPGTSGAVALGLAHVLVRDGKFARDFVHDRGDGFEPFAASIADYPPARVATITGMPVRTLERLAAELVDAGNAFAVTDERSVGYANGLDTAHAALSLNALIGAFARTTGGLMVEPRPPYAPWPELELDAIATAGLTRARLDGAGTADFPWSRGVHEALPDAIARDTPEVVLLDHANPLWARAQPARWRKALSTIPLVVSFSPFLDESVAELAHVVLPDHTYLERWEDAGPAPGTGKPVAGIRRPVVEPLHDTRPTGDVVLAIARQLGGAVAGALPWPTFAVAVEHQLLGLFDSHRGSIEARGQREFLDRLYTDGFWTDPSATPEAVRFQFHAGWAEPTWAGDPAEFPLTLVAYHPLGYAEGSGANQPFLRHLRTRAGQRPFTTPATLHPQDGPGLSDGDTITITSAFGSIALEVQLDKRMRPGTIAVPMGGGHTAFGRWAKGVGANVMEVLAPGPAPRSGANATCTTRVRVAKHGGA